MLRLATLVLGCAALASCGPSAKEVERARSATYSCAPEEILDVVGKQMGEVFGGVSGFDESRKLMLSRGRWHTANGVPREKGPAVVEDGDLLLNLAVAVQQREGGWAVVAEPMVANQVVGSSQGKELSRKDADWPKWADEKTDVFVVRVYDKLSGCARK